MDPNYTDQRYVLLHTHVCRTLEQSTYQYIHTSTDHFYKHGVNKGAAWDSVLNVNIDPAGFLMGGGGLNLQNGTLGYD